MNKADANYPAFEEAELRFREFLKSAEWPGDLIWIGAHDVAVSDQSLIVHPTKEGREQAISNYQKGIEKKLGILLTAVCRDGSRTYCAVWVPSDETEAEYALMPQGLNFSVPSEQRQGKIVTGRFEWWWRRRKATPWRLM